MSVTSHLGNFVKQRREEVNISQAKLSKGIGYKNGQYVSNIERGKCSIPAVKIRSLAITLKTTPRVIIDEMVKDYHDHLMKKSGEKVA